MSIESSLERLAAAAERQAVALETFLLAATGMGVPAPASTVKGKAIGIPVPADNTDVAIEIAAVAEASGLPAKVVAAALAPPPAVNTTTSPATAAPTQAPPKNTRRKPAPTQAQPTTPAAPVATAPAPAPTSAAPVPTATHPVIPSVKMGAPLSERTGQAVIALANDFDNRDAALAILKQYNGAIRVAQIPPEKLQAVFDEAVSTYAQLKSAKANQELI